MKGARGEVLYIGKAANLRRRVTSYFTRPHDYRIEKLVSLIKRVDYEITDSAVEALIIEADRIKKFQPPYNIREKDDTSFLFIEITKEKYPRVILARGKDKESGRRFGPFTMSRNARLAYNLVRRIFSFSTHANEKIGEYSRPCLDAEIGLCPGTCDGSISENEYGKIIKKILLFLDGKKKRVLSGLEREMKRASKNMEYEKAGELKKQIFALKHIEDAAFIGGDEFPSARKKETVRIEAYDISNISGTSAVGSMVVFENSRPDKREYRKFRIKTTDGPNDVAMMEEIISRRFRNKWKTPDLILIDGGVAQVRVAEKVVRGAGYKIPVIGLAKGPDRKKNELIGKLSIPIEEKILIRARDEAHRFAISYHKKLRSAKLFAKDLS